MDSLKTLMDKKQYDLVIKLTENSNDSLSLFYRLSALLAVGKIDEALLLIKNKRLIMQQRLALLIKFHIEILCLLKRFDEAFDELRYYQDLPYESQEVEEVLRMMPNYIRNEEKHSYGNIQLTPEEINLRLLSKNDEEVLAALDEIKNASLNDYLLSILKLMRSHPRVVIRSFALLLLVNQKYDKEVDFLHNDKLVKVVPSSLEEPFVLDNYKSLDDVSYALQNEYHDPSVTQNALHLLSSYLIYIYPDRLTYSKEEIIVIFGYLAKRLLQINTTDLEDVCLTKVLNYQSIVSAINNVDEVLKNF